MLRRTPFSFTRLWLSHTPLWAATGTIRRWDDGKRFGFVLDDELQESLFVHADECVFSESAVQSQRRTIAQGARVEYTVELDQRKNDGTRRCTKVTEVGGTPLPEGPFVVEPPVHSRGRDDTNVARRAKFDNPIELAGRRDVSGKIVSLQQSFGFIEMADDLKKYGNMFFSVSAVLDGQNLSVGDTVCFDIDRDPRKDGKVLAKNLSKVL